LNSLSYKDIIGFINVNISGKKGKQKLKDIKINTGYAGEEGTKEEFKRWYEEKNKIK